MARGFESKDVEYQQAEREREKTFSRALSPEERDAQDRRRTLELSLARARADLAAATSPRHRAMLADAIAALQQQLESSDDARERQTRDRRTNWRGAGIVE